MKGNSAIAIFRWQKAYFWTLAILGLIILILADDQDRASESNLIHDLIY